MFFGKKTPFSKPTSPDLKSGSVSVKDLIAPPFVEVDFNHLQIGEYFYRTLFVVGYPRFVGPNWLAPLISFDHPLYISFFIYPSRSSTAMKDLQRKIAEMEATINSDTKSGHPVDPTVQVSLDDALALQTELAQGTEHFFQFGFYITIPAKSKEELDFVCREIDSTLSSFMLVSKLATLEMEEGFKSTLPLFKDELKVWRNMDTTSIATTFPFSTASLTSNEGILYGLNDHDGSLLVFDRFALESANSVILGKSGSGKSYLIKLEVARLLMTGIEVIVLDPENEYESLTHDFGGEFISFSIGSEHKINPFEFDTLTPEPDELSNKILSLHSLFKVIVGDLTPSEDALLDKALVAVYKEKGISQDPETFKFAPPLISDLFRVLQNMPDEDARDLSSRLEKFISGSAAGIFNQPSNISLKSRLTVFGIRDLEENLRPVAMHVVLDHIWNIIRHDQVKRVLVIDEAWYLVQHSDSAEYLHGLAKRARKYQLGLTMVTQDVEDFLSVDQGKALLTNSSLQILLKQSPAAIDHIVEVFNVSKSERQRLLSFNIGEGLFFAGQSHVVFKVVSSEKEHQRIT